MVECLDLEAPCSRPVKAKCVEGCCRLCYLSQLTHLRCVVRPPQEGPKLAIDREFPNLQPIADQLRPAYSGATCCYSLVASRVTDRRPESPFRTRQRERAPHPHAVRSLPRGAGPPHRASTPPVRQRSAPISPSVAHTSSEFASYDCPSLARGSASRLSQ